jgi:hypothetical protein
LGCGCYAALLGDRVEDEEQIEIDRPPVHDLISYRLLEHPAHAVMRTDLLSASFERRF